MGIQDERARGDGGGGRADRPGRRPRPWRRSTRRVAARATRSATRSRSRRRPAAAARACGSVRAAGELAGASTRPGARAQPYFGDDGVYVERYLDDPRHVEVQVLADAHGNVIHLGERDCTIQRRHQKLIEESPSPAVVAGAARRASARSAVDAARAVGYTGAGTVECLLDARRRVLLPRDEHAPAGRAHGHRDGDRLDLVGADPRRRAASRCRCAQDDVRLHGHAIECRINAEDPARGLRPDARAG